MPNCGVPQGSVLSPISFGFFISDLQTFNSSSCFKYADDSTFVIPHFKHDITPDIKEVANHMLKWCTANKLELNFAKTQLLTVKKSQNIIYTEIYSIKQMENIKILGITLNKNLKWDNNTVAKTKSASSYLYLIRKFRNVFSKSELILIYNAYILSKIYMHVLLLSIYLKNWLIIFYAYINVPTTPSAAMNANEIALSTHSNNKFRCQ